MRDGKLNLTELYFCGHGDASVFCNTPAARVRNLGDESVGMTAVKDTRDFGAFALRIGNAVQVREVFKDLPDIRIGEAADHVLASQQSVEDLDFVASNGIERFG